MPPQRKKFKQAYARPTAKQSDALLTDDQACTTTHFSSQQPAKPVDVSLPSAVPEENRQFSLGDLIQLRKPEPPLGVAMEAQPESSAPASGNKTLLISWRYDGPPPVVTKEMLEQVLSLSEIYGVTIEQIRPFRHKVYADCCPAPPATSLGLVKANFPKVLSDASPSTRLSDVFVKFDTASNTDLSTVFVGNLVGVDANDLGDYIENALAMRVVAIRIPRDVKTGRAKNFGYVQLSCRDDAKRAASQLLNAKLGLSTGLRADLLVQEGAGKVSLKKEKHILLE